MSELLRIDLGAGKNGREGFIKVDVRKFDGVDVVCNLGTEIWPWEDNSVDEAHSSHMIEHLTAMERVHFVNELYRVSKPDAKTTIIVPHWSSCRAYGDLTHQWPPVSEFWFFYLKKEWRDVNAPHNDFYTCDFDATWGSTLHPLVAQRNQEYQSFAMTFYKEASQDLVATLVAKKGAQNASK